MNSARTPASVRKEPRTEEVTVTAFCFSTPRIIMQRWAQLMMEAAGEAIDDAGDLAEADDVAVGDVADVATSVEGQEMVLAEGVDLDVADDDHVVGGGLEDGAVEDLLGCLAVALREIGHRLGDALGGLLEAFTIGVLAELDEELADEGGNLGLVGFAVQHGRMISWGVWERTSQPVSVMTRRSSMRTPTSPGM